MMDSVDREMLNLKDAKKVRVGDILHNGCTRYIVKALAERNNAVYFDITEEYQTNMYQYNKYDVFYGWEPKRKTWKELIQ